MAKKSARRGTKARSNEQRSRGWIVPVALLVLVLVGVYGFLDVRDVVPGVLTDSPTQPAAAAEPQVELPGAVPSVDAAGPDKDAPIPTEAALAQMTQKLAKDSHTGSHPGVVVVDAETDNQLFTTNAAKGYVPASSLKLLVAIAAIETLGNDHRFETSVVSGGDGTITLVAGGDLTLGAGKGDPNKVIGHAGLGDLADQVATSLKADGTKKVALRLDDTIFTGPRMAPRWTDVDLNGGWGMKMSPLAVNIGIIDGRVARSEDSAMDATRIFAKALKKKGITVSGDIERAEAPGEVETIASVESARLEQIVNYTLIHSENILSEDLGRMTAVGNEREGSFAGATASVLEVLKGLGLDTSGVSLADTSGLSSKSKVTPQLLAQALTLITSGKHQELLTIADGVPVAGLEGTLSDRLTKAPAAGVVRAKTGTLTQAVALAGFVTTKDGRLLTYAVMVNDFEVGGVNGARGAVDAWAQQLAGCGCS